MYHVNKAFISCKGIHLEGGITDSNEWQALFRQEILNVSDQTILLVDSSKFSVRTFVQICSVEDVDQIITDEHLSDQDLELYKSLPVSIQRLNEKNK